MVFDGLTLGWVQLVDLGLFSFVVVIVVVVVVVALMACCWDRRHKQGPGTTDIYT